ncbi:MAG: bifunctional nuclease family protein [Candidatus Aenigmarchaeota archaeon]|nr:bifunctional nuclease family protein [Candidatus Aenigmarchaeota archaeon]
MAKAKRDSLVFYKALSIIAIAVALVAVLQPYLKSIEFSPALLPISELSTQGYTKMDVQVSTSENTGVVILNSQCWQLTASTELTQVESIANGLEGKFNFRPNSHDLMKDALDGLDVEVVMVKVIDIQNNTFIGRLVLKQGDKIVSLDSRPSDGIAIAVRTNAPVYMKNELLEQQGKYTC